MKKGVNQLYYIVKTFEGETFKWSKLKNHI